jgi:predicted PurR-regulated permease PerM/FKBP-type peptidyl-prolyl cis-trans isomerase
MTSQVPIWRRPRAQLLALTGIVWALVLAVLAAARDVLLPFVLAALAAYVIDPLIVRLARRTVAGRRVPRALAVVGVYLVLSAGVYVVAVSIVPQIYREAVRGLLELREFLAGIGPDRVEAWAATIDGFMQRYGIPVDVLPGGGRAGARIHVDLAAEIAAALRDLSAQARTQLGDVVALSRALLAGAVKTIFFFVLLFMLTAFLSMDGPRIVRFAESLVPAAWRGDFRRLVHGIDTGLAGVVRGQLTIMIVNGVLTFAGLLVLRIPFAFALSALATLLYVVPIFGTILSSIPIVLLALTAGGLPKGLLALAWILVIHALETYVLNPKIMGDAARIHPVLIVLALVIGERTAGIVGALLAVPSASVLVAVFRFLHRKLAEIDGRATAIAAAAEEPPKAAAPKAEPPRVQDDPRTLYGVGLAIARSLETFALSPAELEQVMKGVRDGVGGKAKMPFDQKLQSSINDLARARAPKAAEKAAAREKDAGAPYLAKMAKEPSARKTASGAIVIPTQEGSGASPKETDKVKVNYTGTLVNGTVFDSSQGRGPAEFPLNQVVKCWTEALQLMKVGGKAKVVCPSAIAYGERGNPPVIPGNAVLTFDVELLDIVK